MAQPAPTSAHGAALYERDYAAWLDEQAALLRAGRTDALDLANLAEEIADMGIGQRDAVESNLIVVLKHLLKYQFQPARRSRSWLSSLDEHRRRLNKAFVRSPVLARHARIELAECYRHARRQAAHETALSAATFPEACPYSLEMILDEEFLPDADAG